jgi:hypothetical protein
VNIYSEHQKRLTELELLAEWCRYTGSKGNRNATTRTHGGCRDDYRNADVQNDAHAIPIH